MSDFQPAPTTAAPGWYPDPTDAGVEKWWTGTEWSTYTHKAAKNGLFGPSYARNFWPGANRAAWWAVLFGRITAGGFVLAVIATIFIAVTVSKTNYAPIILLLVGLGVFLIGAIITLVFAIIGLTRSRRLGARGVCIQLTIASSVLILIGLGSTLVIAAAVASLSAALTTG